MGKTLSNTWSSFLGQFGGILDTSRKKYREKWVLDIQGIEPWTSRMRSVRATTVPNARER